MSSDNGIEPALVDNLLALETREQQTKFLRDAGLLNADGLERLLNVAEWLTRDDPGKTHELAELCSDVANDADASAAVPRAAYVRVQAYDADGQFDEALRLIDVARDGYTSIGKNVEALRTEVGRMAVLLDLGRYQEVLATGQFILDTLDSTDELIEFLTLQEADSLVAFVHQNRGVCYEHTGRYDESLVEYSLASNLYEKLGLKENLGEVLDNKGSVLSYLGQGNEALASHKAAAVIFEEAGLTLSLARSLSNIGETQLRLADYMGSLNAFEQARKALEPFDAHAIEFFILRNTADAYLALNLHSEALVSYQDVISQLQSVGMEHDHARALWGMGSVLIARSELEEAEEVLARAARSFSTAGNIPMLSGVMLEQAALLEAQGKHETALTTAHQATNLLSGDGWLVQQVYACLRLADLSLPNIGEAEPHLLAARRLVDHLTLPQLRYRLNERLGHLRRLQGREEEAQALLEEAVSEIERLRGAVVQDAMRASFLRDKAAAYEDLLLLHLARDHEESVRRAFAVAERAKSRALVDLLTGVAEKKPVDSADPELEKHIRILQADLNAVYSELLGRHGDSERPTLLPELHARAIELEQEISRLRLQSAAVGHDPFATPVQTGGAWDRMPPDTMLLAYHTVGDQILAFVSARGQIRVTRHLCTVDEVERLLQKLNVQWERFRAGRKFAGRHMAMMERSARQVLAALYDELVAPMEPLLEEAAISVPGRMQQVPKLAVVPHGPLHRIPFHALFDGVRYLIERFEISYAPSATVYALCQDQEPSGREGAAVFGVEDPLIPAATAEAHAIAERLSGAGVCVGEDATIEALQDNASGNGILHLACHGLFRSDNPMFSALKLHDGWLTAADAMSLNLSGVLVTLSACESGRGEVIGGDEVLGLTRAFLGAGAATLVVSLWLVQDETTAELMGKYYEGLRDGAGPVEALRSAQLELKERYPHPYYWAPFLLIGKR